MRKGEHSPPTRSKLIAAQKRVNRFNCACGRVAPCTQHQFSMLGEVMIVIRPRDPKPTGRPESPAPTVCLKCKTQDRRSNRDGRRTQNPPGLVCRLRPQDWGHPGMQKDLGIQSSQSSMPLDPKRSRRPELTLVCKLRHKDWGPPGMPENLGIQSNQ